MKGCAEDETCTSFLCLGILFSAEKFGCGLMIYTSSASKPGIVLFCVCVCAWPFSIEVELVLTCSFSAGGHRGSMQSVANEDTAFFL